VKLVLVSDLHIEFCPISLPGDPEATLLLAGDIIPAIVLKSERTDKESIRLQDRTKKFFDDVSSKYKAVYYIMGNHEHYHGIFEESFGILTDFTKDINITCLNGTSVPLTDTTRLFGATLWTNMYNMNPMALNAARMGMNDFAGHIRHQKNVKTGMLAKFTPEESVIEHERILAALATELKQNPNNEFLVMGHHCPSYQSVHPRYQGDWMNYAYCSNLDDWILDHPQIKNWVHGHTHTPFDYNVGDCRVMCNPRGYTRYEHVPPENAEFNPNFSFEVK
jgi:UDP-2,3-diacylglucosamine pyrophosphatase LpxH